MNIHRSRGTDLPHTTEQHPAHQKQKSREPLPISRKRWKAINIQTSILHGVLPPAGIFFFLRQHLLLTGNCIISLRLLRFVVCSTPPCLSIRAGLTSEGLRPAHCNSSLTLVLSKRFCPVLFALLKAGQCTASSLSLLLTPSAHAAASDLVELSYPATKCGYKLAQWWWIWDTDHFISAFKTSPCST